LCEHPKSVHTKRQATQRLQGRCEQLQVADSQ